MKIKVVLASHQGWERPVQRWPWWFIIGVQIGPRVHKTKQNKTVMRDLNFFGKGFNPLDDSRGRAYQKKNG